MLYFGDPSILLPFLGFQTKPFEKNMGLFEDMGRPQP